MPRFIPLGGGESQQPQASQRFQPLGGAQGQPSQRFIPVPSGGGSPRGGQGLPSAPHPSGGGISLPGAIGAGLGVGASTLGLSNLFGSLGGGGSSPGLSGAASGLTAGAGIANLAAGNTVPGAFQTAQGLAGLGGNPTIASALGLPSNVASGLGIGSGVLGLGTGALSLAQGQEGQGASQIASGALPLIGNAADAGLLGTGLGLAGGAEAAAGTADLGLAGAGALGGELSAAAGLGIVGAVPALGLLLHSIFSGMDQEGISKEMMTAKQNQLLQGAQGATDTALGRTKDFSGVLNVLARIPAGTGQVQYGVGSQYTGETQTGTSALTATPGWSQTLQQGAHNPHQFIQDFWAQTGQGGATSFSPDATRKYQSEMLAALPPTPENNAFASQLLNSTPRDPRTAPGAPDAPLGVADQFLRVGYAKIDTTHEYQRYRTDLVPPSFEPVSAARVASELGAIAPGVSNGSLFFDKTAGTHVVWNGVIDPAYQDPSAALSPYWQQQITLQQDAAAATAQGARDASQWSGGGN